MKFQKEPFDTSILGQDVYRVALTATTTIRDIQNAIKKIRRGIYYCFISVEPKEISIMEKLQFHFVSIRNTYTYIGASRISKPTLEKKYSIGLLRSADRVSSKDIESLAAPIYKMSRYYKDRLIPRVKGKLLYIQWVNNSLYKGYANAAVVARYKGKAIGLCTVKIKDQIGYIDLLGVVAGQQNRKIGKYLLLTSIDYLRTREIKGIRVVTEGENISANIFYQKNGFILRNVQLVYHKHVRG